LKKGDGEDGSGENSVENEGAKGPANRRRKKKKRKNLKKKSLTADENDPLL
jgi:hypothetical protein